MNLVPGHIDGVGEEGAKVRLRDGSKVLAAVRAGEATVGMAVTLGVRSEHLSLDLSGPGDHIETRVHWVEQLGDTTFAYLESAAAQAPVLRLPGETPVNVGDTLRVRVPPKRAHVFDEQGMAFEKLH